MEHNTSTKGNIAELAVATEAARKGYYVGFMPQQCPYDMVIDRGNGPERVQVKYRKLNSRGACELKLDVTHQRNNNTVYTSDNVDAIVVYEETTSSIAWIDIKLTKGRGLITIRAERPKNNQTKGIMLFEEYSDW